MVSHTSTHVSLGQRANAWLYQAFVHDYQRVFSSVGCHYHKGHVLGWLYKTLGPIAYEIYQI